MDKNINFFLLCSLNGNPALKKIYLLALASIVEFLFSLSMVVEAPPGSKLSWLKILAKLNDLQF